MLMRLFKEFNIDMELSGGIKCYDYCYFDRCRNDRLYVRTNDENYLDVGDVISICASMLKELVDSTYGFENLNDDLCRDDVKLRIQLTDISGDMRELKCKVDLKEAREFSISTSDDDEFDKKWSSVLLDSCRSLIERNKFEVVHTKNKWMYNRFAYNCIKDYTAKSEYDECNLMLEEDRRSIKFWYPISEMDEAWTKEEEKEKVGNNSNK